MTTQNQGLRIWLLINILLILVMIWLGGATRLTQSGLSMVEWKPVTGWIPPLNETSWQIEFNKYKNFPEYQKINLHMSLEDFKSIYYWEFFHRVLGRLIGLVYFLPLVLFHIRKKIPQPLKKWLWLGFIFGGSQGVIGWYMVKSGLVNNPHVSHYRLALHFMAALFIMTYLFWIQLQLHPQKIQKNSKTLQKFYTLTLYTWAGLFSLQLVYGAFMAGKKAGYLFNTFPKMGDVWWPTQALTLTPYLKNFLDSPVGIQMVHRALAWGLFFLLPIMAIFNKKRFKKMSSAYLILLMMTLSQILLGITTLVAAVPIVLASLHQVTAALLVLSTVYIIYENKYSTLQDQ